MNKHENPVEVLVADPPWSFSDALPGRTRGAEKQYKVLGVEGIKAFPLPPLADDAVLFLWRVSAMVEEAYAVCRAWGFVPKSEIVWAKKPKGSIERFVKFEDAGAPNGMHFGMGRYVRASHESCIIARRGKFKVASHSVRSVFFAAVREHSEKPEEFFELVEKLVGDGPGARGAMCELFGRRVHRLGWHVYGNGIPGGHVYMPRVKVVDYVGPEFAKAMNHKIVGSGE